MLETPQVVAAPLQRTAYIHLAIPRSSIEKEMGPAIKELMAALREQGVAPEGPVVAHHLRMDPASFDFEVGVPVAEEISESGRVRSGHIPAAQVVRSVYTGPYEGLRDAWGELNEWIRSQGLTMAPNLWEVYTRGPESTEDSSSWKTELNRPIIG